MERHQVGLCVGADQPTWFGSEVSDWGMGQGRLAVILGCFNTTFSIIWRPSENHLPKKWLLGPVFLCYSSISKKLVNTRLSHPTQDGRKQKRPLCDPGARKLAKKIGLLNFQLIAALTLAFQIKFSSHLEITPNHQNFRWIDYFLKWLHWGRKTKWVKRKCQRVHIRTLSQRWTRLSATKASLRKTATNL